MRGYDFFLLVFCGSIILVPMLFGVVRVIEWLAGQDKNARQERQAEAYIKRIMGEK